MLDNGVEDSSFLEDGCFSPPFCLIANAVSGQILKANVRVSKEKDRIFDLVRAPVFEDARSSSRAYGDRLVIGELRTAEVVYSSLSGLIIEGYFCVLIASRGFASADSDSIFCSERRYLQPTIRAKITS